MPENLTPEQVMTWMADNPGALRLASAEAAAELLNGPVVQTALDALLAALEINQDSATTAGQPRAAGDEGSRETLQRVANAIVLGRTLVAARVTKLSPPEAPETPPEGPAPE
jgi:hypothetical protein